MKGQQSPIDTSTKLQWIAQVSKNKPGVALTNLAHHIDIEFLHEAYWRTRKDSAVGVDNQTAKQYEANLESNLQSLLTRFKAGTYRAPVLRRAYIPKGDGKSLRALGMPTFEDKVLQRAVTMVLEAVYEQEFLPCSYGSRPKRSAHQALKALRDDLMEMEGGTVLELDIQKFFDNINHSQLREILDKRIGDGVLRKAIDKWLKTGVFEDGRITLPTKGAPQGGVCSPILSNIYLHEVLDLWFEQIVKPRMKGRSFLVRYVDDAVLIFELAEDAQRVMAVLPKRFGKYGLTLHPDKTRIVSFKHPWKRGLIHKDRGEDSFDLLGFTHYWGKSQRGGWSIKRKTAKDRFKRGIRKISEWCRKHRHRPIEEQQKTLGQKLRGHYEYYGITGNSIAIERFAHEVKKIWRKWLDRRSQHRHMPWEHFQQLLKRYPLPVPICVHSIYRRLAKP